MKKILIAALLLCAALQAGAQSVSDAYLYSRTDYLGTARSVGMGNAMTAVGGDLGSIVFNPAGSAIAGYSQFSFTPNISISSTDAIGTPLSGSSEPYGFEDPNVTARPRMLMPNIGAIMHVKTGRHRGLKSWSFGVMSHMTDNYLNEGYASGSNYNTSYAGYVASLATGIQKEVMDGQNIFDQVGWIPAVGYRSDLITTYGGHTDQYLGATERETTGGVAVADGLHQKYGWLRTGSKNEFLCNFGLNFSDRFYLGANVGVTAISLEFDEYWNELAMDPKNFPIRFKNEDGTFTDTYFDRFKMLHSYSMDGSGVYAKVGFIALPVQGLRIGGAIQTPTVTTVREYYSYDARTVFTDGSQPYSKSPDGDWAYSLTSPFRFNVGAAYTFGQLGMLSVDYEHCNFSAMRFSTAMYYNDDYSDINADIRSFMGVSHMLRVGGELRPMPEMAIRVGYNLTTNPEKDDAGKYIRANRENVSFGLGYSSPGSFFADLGFRMNFLPDDYIMPYPDYCYDTEGKLTVLSPEICSRQRLYDVLLTIGFRF